MRTQNYLLLIASIFFVSSTLASVPKVSEKDKLLEELTGQQSQAPEAAKTKTPAVEKSNANLTKKSAAQAAMPISRRHLNAGFQAYMKKDYIKALKHYNTILVKHYNTPEVKSAYLAKAKLYQEMGLIEQAQLNVKLANEFEKKIQVKK